MKPEALEQEVRRSLSREVDRALGALDARMAPHLRAAVPPAKRPAGPWRWARPALVPAAVALALILAFWLGELQVEPLGPRSAAELGRPRLATAGGSAPPLIALYRAAGQGQLEASLTRAPLAAAVPESAGKLPLESLPAAPPSPAAIDLSAVASVAPLGGGLVVPAGDRLLRVAPDQKSRVLITGLEQASGAAVGPRGAIYFTERRVDGRLIRLEGTELVALKTGLVYPAGLAFAPDGSLYLAEQGRGRLLRLAPQDGQITPDSPVEVVAVGLSGALGTGGEGPPQGGPFALSVTPTGELWVSDLRGGQQVIYRIPLQVPWWERLFR